MKIKNLLIISIFALASCISKQEKEDLVSESRRDTSKQNLQIKKELQNKSKLVKQKNTKKDSFFCNKRTNLKKEKVVKINSNDERLKVVFDDTIYYKRNIKDQAGWRWCPEDNPNMGLYFDVKKKTWYAIKTGKNELVLDLGKPCRPNQFPEN